MKSSIEISMLKSKSWWAKLYRWIIYKPQYLFVTTGSVFIFLLTISSLITVAARRTGIGGSWAAGGNDLAQILMSMITTMGLAYCWYLGRHVRIGIIRDNLSPRLQSIIDALSALAALLWVVIMSFSTWQLGLFNIQTNYFTRMLEIPIGPFQVIFSIVLAQFALVLVISFLGHLADVLKPSLKARILLDT